MSCASSSSGVKAAGCTPSFIDHACSADFTSCEMALNGKPHSSDGVWPAGNVPGRFQAVFTVRTDVCAEYIAAGPNACTSCALTHTPQLM